MKNDAQAMFDNWASRSENLTYVTWNPHLNVEQTRNSIGNWIASYDNPNYYKWAICLKENPDYVIGDISLVSVDEENSSCEIGYILGMDYWGRGLMTEALKSVLSYCLDEIEFKEINACYASLNPASGRVMEKAGMTFGRRFQMQLNEKVISLIKFIIKSKNKMEKNNFSILFFVIYFLIKIKQIFAGACKEVETIFSYNTTIFDTDANFTRDVDTRFN